MHRSYFIIWLCLVSVCFAGQLPLDVATLGTPCLAGLDIGRNTCKESGDPDAEISRGGLEVEDCLSDDCDTPWDPLSKGSKLSPWSLPPRCIHNDEFTNSYCVYTDTDFAQGRGISIFSSPSTASTISKLPAFTQADIRSQLLNSTTRPFEVRHIPGKGNGLFATRELQRGDLILADLPVGAFQSEALSLDYQEDYRYLHISYEQLPKKAKELFMQTAAHYEGDPLMERINTNAFHGVFEGKPHFLLYPETARMNHACRPNTMSYHDPQTLIHATHASRPIYPGEEITITYIDILQSRSARQHTLSTHWGFTCNCPTCSSPPSEISISDARITQIHSLQTALRDWSPNPKILATPQMAGDLIKLYSQEHVYAAMATGYVLAALAHNAVGETAMAMRYAQAAVEAGLVTGAVDGDVEDVKGLAREGGQRSHWSYNKRKGRN